MYASSFFLSCNGSLTFCGIHVLIQWDQDSAKLDEVFITGARIPTNIRKHPEGYDLAVTEAAVKSIVCNLLKIVTESQEEWMSDVHALFFKGRSKNDSVPTIPKGVCEADRNILSVLVQNYVAVYDRAVDHATAFENFHVSSPDWEFVLSKGIVCIKGPYATKSKQRAEDKTGEIVGFVSDVSMISLELFVRRDYKTKESTTRQVTIGELDDLATYVNARRNGLGFGLEIPKVFSSFLDDEASIRHWWWSVWAELLHCEFHAFGGHTYLTYRH